MVVEPPQLNVMAPPPGSTVATAESSAASVQLAGVPVPTTASAASNGDAAATVMPAHRTVVYHVRAKGPFSAGESS